MDRSRLNFLLYSRILLLRKYLRGIGEGWNVNTNEIKTVHNVTNKTEIVRITVNGEPVSQVTKGLDTCIETIKMSGIISE